MNEERQNIKSGQGRWIIMWKLKSQFTVLFFFLPQKKKKKFVYIFY